MTTWAAIERAGDAVGDFGDWSDPLDCNACGSWFKVRARIEICHTFEVEEVDMPEWNTGEIYDPEEDDGDQGDES